MSLQPRPWPDPAAQIATALRVMYAWRRAPLPVVIRDELGEVFADEVFADEVFADEVFADEVFADEVFADEAFADEAFADEVFAGAFADRGTPGWSPVRLALVTALQMVENLTDRQAAVAVQDKISWKYALGLGLADAGFDFRCCRSSVPGWLVTGWRRGRWICWWPRWSTGS